MSFKKIIQRELLKVIERIIETNEKIQENSDKHQKLYKKICIMRV